LDLLLPPGREKKKGQCFCYRGDSTSCLRDERKPKRRLLLMEGGGEEGLIPQGWGGRGGTEIYPVPLELIVLKQEEEGRGDVLILPSRTGGKSNLTRWREG